MIRGGPPTWGLGDGLTPQHKNKHVTNFLKEPRTAYQTIHNHRLSLYSIMYTFSNNHTKEMQIARKETKLVPRHRSVHCGTHIGRNVALIFRAVMFASTHLTACQLLDRYKSKLPKLRLQNRDSVPSRRGRNFSKKFMPGLGLTQLLLPR
jgi:hypothetical protein